jgi:hypothetical protein
MISPLKLHAFLRYFLLRREQAYPYEVAPDQTAMFVKEENLRRRSRHPQTLNKTAK